MQKMGLSPPLFESDRSRDLFTTIFLFHHFLGEEDLQWLANFRSLQLSDEQARALVFTKEVGAINNNAYRNINQVDTLTASASLRNLRDLGLLEAKNQGSKTYYLPTEQLLAPLKEQHQFEGKGHQLEEFCNLPDDLQFILTQLGKKVPSTKLREAIIALCEWKEMTTSELAAILKRDKKRLVRKYLTPMTKEGLLQYKYPQMLEHPGQAYRTKQSTTK